MNKILKEKPFNIYIGWDSREPIAAEVCRFSLLKHSSIPLNISFLKQEELREKQLYWRELDKLSSTEFTFTRFLVPYLNNYQGYAIFVDCDFLYVEDIAELLQQIDPKKAVTVVQHDYTPPEGVKMDGKRQHPYPRKNWSSMIVWNCEHPDNKAVDLDAVNSASGQDLHRFTWLKDRQIGSVSPEWNWLVGWYREYRDGFPCALHYTEGGPWFEQYRDCEFAETWLQYLQLYQDSRNVKGSHPEDLELPDNLKNIIKSFLWKRRDPDGLWFKDNDFESLLDHLPLTPNCVGVVDGDPDPELEPEIKKVDVILDAFLTGSDGVITISKKTPDFDSNIPVVIRGIAKRKIIHRCAEEGRDYFYIDTGYFGNWKHKTYHRITKNNMQYVGNLDPNCPDDRLNFTNTHVHKHRPGKNILICPPSQKAMNYWNLDLEEWLDNTVQQIEKHTDRPIVIRKKMGRSDRVNTDTMEMALSRDVHCMVTFNSIAAVESLIYGKPVFTMGPNAAQPLANTDLALIENPRMPRVEEVRNLLCNLAYQQFTVQEMKDGTAWRMLNGE